MKTSSAKAKGRLLQQIVRNALRIVGVHYSLVDDDIESRGMGQNGRDIILSPAARKVFGELAIECKNQQTLNVPAIFFEHADKYTNDTPLLAHKKNATGVLITMRLVDYIDLLEKSLQCK